MSGGGDKSWPRLSAAGYELLFVIDDVGMDVDSDDLADALEEAEQRITGGPCKGCGADVDTRYGWCYKCATETREVLDALTGDTE